jgi:hypothetical protein
MTPASFVGLLPLSEERCGLKKRVSGTARQDNLSFHTQSVALVSMNAHAVF